MQRILLALLAVSLFASKAQAQIEVANVYNSVQVYSSDVYWLNPGQYQKTEQHVIWLADPNGTQADWGFTQEMYKNPTHPEGFHDYEEKFVDYRKNVMGEVNWTTGWWANFLGGSYVTGGSHSRAPTGGDMTFWNTYIQKDYWIEPNTIGTNGSVVQFWDSDPTWVIETGGSDDGNFYTVTVKFLIRYYPLNGDGTIDMWFEAMLEGGAGSVAPAGSVKIDNRNTTFQYPYHTQTFCLEVNETYDLGFELVNIPNAKIISTIVTIGGPCI